MTSDSALFRTRDELEADGWCLEGNVFVRDGKRMLPLYEGKMFHHFTSRWGSAGDHGVGWASHPTARYWVAEATCEAAGAEPLLLGYRNIARSTDERTIICSLLPRVAANNSVLLVRVDPPELDRRLLFLAVISSFAFDYVARNKVGGMT